MTLQVLIPGDPEREANEARVVTGIPVKMAVIRDMEDICKHTGVKFTF